jgi:S-adenosylmethionine:tRNA ribosyltransferase-isomerase
MPAGRDGPIHGGHEGAVRQQTGAPARPGTSGLARDEVGLLVSSRNGHEHTRFDQLPMLLRRGDVLTVNRSATLPASLEAKGRVGPFLLNLCTRYGRRLWLAEPRWTASRPGPLPLLSGERIEAAGLSGTLLAEYPGIARLIFVLFDEDPASALASLGRPIRYGYLTESLPLSAYQTVFSDRPGSAEMPSAARPFSERTVAALKDRGVEIVSITLHAGVSSLEAGDLRTGDLYPEPFEVTEESATRLNAALAERRRILAVGTTVVRALASAWNGRAFRATRGMTTLFVRPGLPLPPLAGLLTGFHDPQATHLQMLAAVAGEQLVADGYREAHAGNYRWHEFGDSHLLLTETEARVIGLTSAEALSGAS